ncbi:MAG: NAD(P)H-hydrate dehydratase [Actinomycetota bacterium]|nr:NAD(P)H-hydrate dehydratase [Actinomycetota bacterium]MDD5668338.1 NAD(P)H-hydrate dehydratase [Actinomycetota bacterium]
MRVVLPREMAALDRRAIEEGIPSLDLMERAGRFVAEQARDILGLCAGKTIYVVAAKGNNGGDGFVAARYLASWGAKVKVYLLGREDELSAAAAANHRRFVAEGGEVAGAAPGLAGDMWGPDLVIDAIFGTGFHGAAEGEFAAAIEAINASGAPVLAVDVPSGVDAETGGVAGPAVRAVRTVTFAWPKAGLYLFPGAELTGDIVVVDIGIPARLLQDVVESEMFTIEAGMVAELLPRRGLDAHKGSSGRVLVVAGSVGLTGAAALCSRAAMRSGAGVVTLAVPASLNPVMEVKLTEVMTIPLPDAGAGYIAAEALDIVLDKLEDYDVLAIGPGVGTATATCEVVEGLLRRARKPVVLDADGINCAAPRADFLSAREAATVITPHPGELGRLLGRRAGDIQSSRMASAAEAAGRFGCTTVLKGANTLVASPDGRIYVNTLALPSLATAGSGDVLTGCTAALCAQGLEPLHAALCGVFIHGKAAELAAHMVGPLGMVAGDIISHLPLALSGLLREREEERWT